MRKGFTILELLVASLLLGMLMTILTMIFSQSSIAWRTGLAGMTDMDHARKRVADVRYGADNVYVWNGEAKCIESIFDDSGNLRDGRESGEDAENLSAMNVNWEPKNISDSMTIANSQGLTDKFSGSSSSRKNYVVNVMSCGPDRNAGTLYDNIYSLPDDPKNWQE